jgi:hypothetical protein
VKRAIILLTVLVVSACAHGRSGTAADTGAASGAATGAPSQSVSFDDIASISERQFIEDLGALGTFDQTAGHFDPSGPITRAQYVRWLVRANNAIWFDQPSLQIKLAEGPPASFPDVPQSDADFPYVQGVDNAGFAIGFRDKRFHPSAALTHEQLLAIKERGPRRIQLALRSRPRFRVVSAPSAVEGCGSHHAGFSTPHCDADER